MNKLDETIMIRAFLARFSIKQLRELISQHEGDDETFTEYVDQAKFLINLIENSDLEHEYAQKRLSEILREK